jgi:hypothetical protein
MPNIIRGNFAVSLFSTRHERLKPKPAPAVPVQYQPRAPDWTQEQDDYIRKHYYKKPTREIAAKIGRTVKAVQTRASNIGVVTPKCLQVSA